METVFNNSSYVSFGVGAYLKKIDISKSKKSILITDGTKQNPKTRLVRFPRPLNKEEVEKLKTGFIPFFYGMKDKYLDGIQGVALTRKEAGNNFEIFETPIFEYF